MYYIGLSSNLDRRIKYHISRLLSKTHKNYRLQEAANLYGLPEFHILENCSLSELKTREVFWIKEFDSFNNGFNITNGGDGAGYGEGVHSAAYTQEVYYNILKMLATTDKTLMEVANTLEVSINIVKHISGLSSHTWLEEIYPVEYAMLKAKKGRRYDNTAMGKGIKYPSIISPDGTVYDSIPNLHAFCREHGLQAQNLHKVLTGQRKSHKGWAICT